MNKLLKPGLVAACAIAVILLYVPALSGALYYDDYSNLDGLAGIDGWGTAWAFVFDGHAGPLGRPLALLSFLPFSGGWPENASSILLFNVLLHSANFLLFFALGSALLKVVTDAKASLRFRIALVAALMWALLPMLASTSLIAIQRMTGLATFFGVLGLLGFVLAYPVVERKPVWGLCLQLLALGGGTLLSILSKESGALFPVFALLIDVMVVRNIRQLPRRSVALARRIILLAPFLFILFYISPLHYEWWQVSEYRGFSAAERVVTEWVVLWEYLFRTFLPQAPTAYGPFHDYYGIRELNGLTLLAGGAWLITIVLALVLWHRCRWFGFAVFWFLGGHLIESSSVLLELYFEHRNYVAVYGFCLFLSLLAFNARGKLKRAAPVLMAGYLTLLASILLAITVLWGQPDKAAERWNERHPGSARAALHAVFIEMNDGPPGVAKANSEYIDREQQLFAMKVLDRTKAACPDCLDVRLQALMYSCSVTAAGDTDERFEEVIEVAKLGRINVAVVDQLFNIHKIIQADACHPIGFTDLISLIDALSASAKMNVEAYGAKIYFVRAMAAQELGDSQEVWRSLALAEAIAPEALPVLQYQVYYALEQDDVSRAASAIQRRTSNAAVAAQMPLGPLAALQGEVDAAIKEMQR